MEQRILRALDCTWQAIGGDCLEAAGCSERGGTIPRTHVCELVLDADYAAMYGDDREAVAVLYKLPYKLQNKLARKAFPCKRYGY